MNLHRILEHPLAKAKSKVYELEELQSSLIEHLPAGLPGHARRRDATAPQAPHIHYALNPKVGTH
jgi:hypothetical protein